MDSDKRLRSRRDQSSIFFIQVKIVGLPDGGVRQNEGGGDEQSDENVECGVGQEQESDGEKGENEENDPIFEDAAGENERLIAEEVEEEPERQHEEEDEEGNRVPEKGEEEDYEDDDGVVHTEVSEIDFDASESVVEVGRESEGAVIGDHTPRTAVP